MAPALTSLAIAGLAMSAVGTGYSAYAGKRAADKQEDQLNEQARLEQEAATAEAGQIREKARRVKATQRAGLASAGVSLDADGTADALLSETTRLSEQDAMAALSGGANRAALLRGSADIAKDQGRSALISGGLNLAAVGINGATEIKKAGAKARLTDLELNSGAQKLEKASRPKYSLLG